MTAIPRWSNRASLFDIILSVFDPPSPPPPHFPCLKFSLLRYEVLVSVSLSLSLSISNFNACVAPSTLPLSLTPWCLLRWSADGRAGSGSRL